MVARLRRWLVAGLPLLACLNPLNAFGQSPGGPPLEVTVTPLRTEQPIARLGSAVTVISAEDISRANPANVADLLRTVPGLDITVSGTPGSTTSVRLRGAEARHTLVLVDGMRVNDPSTSVSEFDFSNIVPADIERIEVLRGPQSALYGSDAIGGVVNIITRRGGQGAPRVSWSVEGGSHRTFAGRLGVSGGTETLSYSFAIAGFYTQGFSAFGHRIPRLAAFGPFEKDGTEKLGFNGRLRWQATPLLALEFGALSALVTADYDAAFGSMPDSPSRAKARLDQVWTRAVLDAPDGAFRQSLRVYANRWDRDYRNIFAFFGPTTWDNNRFLGTRVGAEYQGDLRLGPWGLLTFGGGAENERAETSARPVLPAPGPTVSTSYGGRTTAHVFAIHQISLGERWHFSAGGRVDHIDGVDTFPTFRLTAAYQMPEIASKLRASVGTGAKAPSLFQLFDPSYGNPALKPEQSVGVDAGIDTALFGGRARLSATVFHNTFRELIDFTFVGGPIGFGTYVNVARAETSGLELEGGADILPGILTARAGYTYTEARDLTADRPLLRRPRHKGAASLLWTPHPKITVEPRVTFVGRRIDFDGITSGRVEMPSYAKLDVRVDYRLEENLSLFLRGENLTNVRYEEVRNYGTPGASVYVGMQGRM